MYKLVICDDEGKTTVVPLIRDEVTIGRKEGNTIRLTDRNVSRFHARVVREEESFRLEDVGSLCGTKVNASLLKSQSTTVSIGDKISIGDYSLSIRTDVGSDVPLGRQMDPGDGAGIGKVTPHARLVILSSEEVGREIDLTADLYVIGRSEEANCRIQDSSISRAHARIDLDAGEWTISDLDSINGILINGVKKDDYVLKPGDIIELGTVRIRYVASGEPYDFESASSDRIPRESVPAEPPSRQLLYILGTVAVLAIIAIIVAFTQFNKISGVGPSTDSARVSERNQTYDTLMEQGKDKVQSEDWAEAARLFELALQKRPDSETAMELKALALSESDAQVAFTTGLEAEQNNEWAKAVAAFGEIPRSSHYYDINQLVAVSGKLCTDLIDKAKTAAEGGEWTQAHQLLDEIGGIPEAPASCRNKKALVRRRIQDEADQSDEGASAPEPGKRGAQLGGSDPSPARARKPRSSRADQKRSAGRIYKRPVNPYAASEKPSQKDPVSEAHAAIRKGDNLQAIAILESAGNSKAVLFLLSKLYIKVGNKRGYDSVAHKFIKLYPADPRTKKFRKNLSL